MSPEALKAVAELIKALGSMLGIVGGLVIVAWSVQRLFLSGNPFKVSVGKFLHLEVRPAEKSALPPVPPGTTRELMAVLPSQEKSGAPTNAEIKPADDSVDLPAVGPNAPIPSDYLYLVHTSFLRPEKQAEFQARTGVSLPHYDIRVKLQSYYANALDRVSYVEYVLHKAFPQPIQRKYNMQDDFELKEVANGEFVLAAQIYLKDQRDPLLLQRYITLWPSGPRI